MKIAIVGGIGSGKSEILRVAREMNLACLSADEINAELLTNPDYVQKIAKMFPFAIEKGAVNKTALAKAIFCDREAREKLNTLAHPLILKRIEKDVRTPLVVEVPLIFESGATKLFDEIVAVVAPLESRVNRLKEYRGMSEEDIFARISSQIDDIKYESIATRVIHNDDTIDALESQARKVFDEILIG